MFACGKRYQWLTRRRISRPGSITKVFKSIGTLEQGIQMMHTYSPENAHTYSQLGVIGTTYEISFNELSKMLGNLQGKTILDFGTGTGRSARLLKTLGAEKVIGVDHDENMIAQAKANHDEMLEFHLLADNTIPLPDESVDVAVSAHVFVEMRDLDEMQQVAKEVSRVLKPNSPFIVVSTNPASIGYEYKSYMYRKKDGLKSGDPITCVIKGETPFEIDDIYWTEEDYRQVLEFAGFMKIQTTFPRGEGENWLDEIKVAPDIILKCIKSV
jgi:ubiquinone/menaquinone biosynthesis C-methylase UbiE